LDLCFLSRLRSRFRESFFLLDFSRLSRGLCLRSRLLLRLLEDVDELELELELEDEDDEELDRERELCTNTTQTGKDFRAISSSHQCATNPRPAHRFRRLDDRFPSRDRFPLDDAPFSPPIPGEPIEDIPRDNPPKENACPPVCVCPCVPRVVHSGCERETDL
jgi:hypothetical protein